MPDGTIQQASDENEAIAIINRIAATSTRPVPSIANVDDLAQKMQAIIDASHAGLVQAINRLPDPATAETDSATGMMLTAAAFRIPGWGLLKKVFHLLSFKGLGHNLAHAFKAAVCNPIGFDVVTAGITLGLSFAPGGVIVAAAYALGAQIGEDTLKDKLCP